MKNKKEKMTGVCALASAIIGAVTFAVGNWYSEVPAEWLTSMAWISSMSLAITAIASGTWWAFKTDSLPAGIAITMVIGATFGIAGIILQNMLNPEFIGENIFNHSTLGIVTISTFAFGTFFMYAAVYMMKYKEWLRGIYHLLGAVMFIVVSFIFSSECNWLKLNGETMEMLAYSTVGCALAALGIAIIAAISSKRL